MNKFILLICIVFCISIGCMYIYKTDQIYNKINDEKESFISDVVKRDSILFSFSKEANNLLLSVQKLCCINKENILIAVIPTQFCWNCFESKAEQLLKIKQKYDIQVIFIVPSTLVRNFRMYFSNKIDYNIVRHIELSNTLVKKIPYTNIIWGLYNNNTDLFITYADSNIINSLSFLEKNYFNQLNL